MCRTHLRVLGICLALLGVMALSASAAQAKWLLLKNKVSVSSLTLTARSGLGRLLVPKLGLTIHCTGDSGSITASLSGENKNLSGNGSLTSTGCTLNESKNCTVKSKGQPNGTIVSNFDDSFIMEGESVLDQMTTATQFTFIEIGNELCPLFEENASVTGKVHLLILEPLSDITERMGHLLSLGLLYGKNEAEIDGTEKGLRLYSLTEATGASFAIHLVEL